MKCPFNSLCGGGVPFSHPSLGLSVFFLSFFTHTRARAASLKAKGSRFGALAEEEYDKIAPVIACTLPALTDSIPERKRKELAGEVTRELQVSNRVCGASRHSFVT